MILDLGRLQRDRLKLPVAQLATVGHEPETDGPARLGPEAIRARQPAVAEAEATRRSRHPHGVSSTPM